jgi:hypothetical protein
VAIVDAMYPYFFGNSVYYLTRSGDLMRIPPDGGPEQLATGDLYNFYPIPGNPQLWMLLRVTPDPDAPEPSGPFLGPRITDVVRASVLDTTTDIETPLPDGLAYQFGTHFSPDGRWLITSKPTSPDPSGIVQLSDVLIDRRTGSIEQLEGSFQFGSWRPGHDEIWATGYDETQPGLAGSLLFIKKPGQPVVVIPGIGYGGFSEDGKYWISASAPPTEQVSEQVIGLADDPAGPKVRLVPPRTSLIGLWTLPDGRMVAESASAAADYFEDFMINVVDPTDGATHLVGERGVPEAVGKTRILGLFQVSFERGDLVSFDVARLRSTTLASEFAMAAVAEPQGDDPYPPGGRIVYQYRARFESQWDGLWLATAP